MLAAQGAQAEPSPSTATAFVRWLYAHYQDDTVHDLWHPLNDDATIARIFEPSTARLIAAANRAPATSDDFLDADPICSCQDIEPNTETISVRMSGPESASADVFIRWHDDAHNTGRVRFDLVYVQGAWRIYDLHSREAASLRATMAGFAGRRR
jgi:hypothetical protein